MHKNEMWQVYAPNGEPVVGEGWDSALGNPEASDSDVIVGVAMVFVYRYNDEDELELLWQKRSREVDRYPGYYDISAGGHINLGETAVEGAVRECREEIGVEVAVEDLQFACTELFNKNRFAWIFMVDWTERNDDFGFNDGEVSEVKWVSYSETERFREKYAKPPLAKNDLTFANLDDWLKSQGIVKNKGEKELSNYAFIDGNNLYLGAKLQGIKLDYRIFRLFLKHELSVERAFYFIGRDKQNRWLYRQLQKCGFELVFKPAVFYDKNGQRMMKGNVDAELVLYSAAVEFDNYDKAVIVTGDGDFACLVKWLKDNNKLKKIITPTEKYSLLLKKYRNEILQLKDIYGGNKSTS